MDVYFVFCAAIAISLGVPFSLAMMLDMQPETERRQLELNRTPRKATQHTLYPDRDDFPPGAFSSDTQVTQENERLAMKNSELQGKINELEHKLQIQKQNSPHCKCGTAMRAESMFCHQCGNRVRQMV